ncbi:hypothetical protein CASFOL_036082 [Castilleja foliolosa]|uniref:Alpha/beta hydrolase fold-3 domain-containing protein n=1 Tax=Castilleja foliolosa TaxID=1961234 RepID=A0ABD3BUL8_9LAMI
MESNPTHITHDFPPFFRVHNTGHIERYINHDFVPASHDHKTDVVSRDVIILPENNVSARIYTPKIAQDNLKLPLIIYIHGGAFSVQSAFSSLYHNYVNILASRSRSVVVSIEYRLAPEHPIPACYDDSFAVVEWISSHSKAGSGSDPWLNEHVDFNRVYLAGDSAGANIAHNMIFRAGPRLKISGLILIHPFFGIGKIDKLWNYICPGTSGNDDFRLNPTADMDLLSKLGCNRVLVCVAEKDLLKKRGLHYYEGLRKSDWKGVVELFESAGEEHVFYLFDLFSDGAVALMERIVGFIDAGSHGT